MIKSGKKGDLVARLSTSKDAVAKIKTNCRSVWSIIKQVWYVPFIWSLAWFSYWIFQESIAIGQPITQSSASNQIGLAISIGAVLIAGYMSGKLGEKNVEKTGKVGILKRFNFLKALVKKKSAKSILPEGLIKKTQSDKLERTEQQSKYYLQNETNQIRKPNETTKSSFQTHDSTTNTRNNANLSNQITQQEIPSECLICPNLISCDQRGKETSDSAATCPYAKDHERHLS